MPRGVRCSDCDWRSSALACVHEHAYRHVYGHVYRHVALREAHMGVLRARQRHTHTGTHVHVPPAPHAPTPCMSVHCDPLHVQECRPMEEEGGADRCDCQSKGWSSFSLGEMNCPLMRFAMHVAMHVAMHGKPCAGP